MSPHKTLILALAIGPAIFAGPLALAAQRSGRIPRIGLLLSASSPDPLFEAFRQGLRDLGHIEGQTIALEPRWAEGKYDRFPAMAAELIGLKVDIIVAAGSVSVQAARQATSTIPIIFASVGDPVGTGLVASLAQPGGNVTGLSPIQADLTPKRLELLKEAVPKLSRVAALGNPANPTYGIYLRHAQAAAQALRVKFQHVEVRDSSELDGAFARMARERVGALVVLPDPLTVAHGKQIADLAVRRRLPTMFAFRGQVEQGGLMFYGANLQDTFRRAAAYVDKILKGAKPADLPVEQPTKFELVVNMKTAKALGLTIPRSVLSLADEVIQ